MNKELYGAALLGICLVQGLIIKKQKKEIEEAGRKAFATAVSNVFLMKAVNDVIDARDEYAEELKRVKEA